VRSTSLALARTVRGTQSSERSSSRIAPPDPGHDIGLELDLPIRVIPFDRADQAPEAVGDQIGLLNVRRQPGPKLAGHVLDQRRVGDYKAFAGSLVLLILAALPQVSELDRLEVCLHRHSCLRQYLDPVGARAKATVPREDEIRRLGRAERG